MTLREQKGLDRMSADVTPRLLKDPAADLCCGVTGISWQLWINCSTQHFAPDPVQAFRRYVWSSGIICHVTHPSDTYYCSSPRKQICFQTTISLFERMGLCAVIHTEENMRARASLGDQAAKHCTVPSRTDQLLVEQRISQGPAWENNPSHECPLQVHFFSWRLGLQRL